MPGALCKMERPCAFDVLTMIRDYVERGWATLTTEYSKDRTALRRVAKESPYPQIVDAQFMRLVAALREFIVTRSFECNRSLTGCDEQRMNVSGSVNPTSDYDVTLMGAGSYFTMWGMFIDFLRTYRRALATAFDVNLYTTGMYLGATTPEMAPYRVDFDVQVPNAPAYRAFTVTPRAAPEVHSQQVWAALKFLDAGVEFPDAKIQAEAVARRRYLDAAFDAAKALFVGVPADDVELVAKYALQCAYARQLDARMYATTPALEFAKDDVVTKVLAGTPAVDAFMDLLSHVRYFSIEGAYTQGAVNVVVIKNQVKVAGLKLHRNDYVCTLIENAGDFMTHANSAIANRDDDAPAFALRCSKYVSRMLGAAVELAPADAVIGALRAAFDADVYSKRGAGVADPAFLELRHYSLAPGAGRASPATILDLKAAVQALFSELWAKCRPTAGGGRKKPTQTRAAPGKRPPTRRAPPARALS